MTSSSPRSASVFEAVVIVDARIVGPVMMPEKMQDDFVAEFNATYVKIGMTIESLPKPDEQVPDEQGPDEP